MVFCDAGTNLATLAQEPRQSIRQSGASRFQPQNILGIGPLKPYPVALTITSAYGTVVPAIVKWSSVM
jgi:hypothetical protein